MAAPVAPLRHQGLFRRGVAHDLARIKQCSRRPNNVPRAPSTTGAAIIEAISLVQNAISHLRFQRRRTIHVDTVTQMVASKAKGRKDMGLLHGLVQRLTAS